MNERTVYVILTEWICEWQESVEITPTAYLSKDEAQAAMQQLVIEAIQAFPTSPAIERCEGYCELSSEGPYGADCVKFSVLPIQIPGAASEAAV